jgi:predicted TIM-barrel fold metal-dependent hydrolase
MTQSVALPAVADNQRGRSRLDVGLVDGDVHLYTPAGLSDVFPHMPAAWRRRFELKGAEQRNPLLLKIRHPTNGGLRRDAAARPGEVPCSDPEFTRFDYLDRYNVDYAISTSLEAAAYAVAIAGPDEAAVLCSAYNDYLIERWCEFDARYRYAICVSVQDPEQAAAEVRRLGAHRGVAAVYMPLQNTLVGSRMYYPIYRAALDFDLPILLHLSGTEGAYQGSSEPCGSNVDSFSERRAGYVQYALANVNSLAFSTVFKRFPALRFAFIEYGFSWLLTTLWRLDNTWKETRIETPWLTELPSQTLREHLRFGTQPIDQPPNPDYLYSILSMLGLDWLLFTTDYPHWDGDEPGSVLKKLSDEEMRRIMRDNAVWMFRL